MYQPYVACAAIRARKRRTVPYRSPYQPQCLEGDDGDDVCHGQAQQDGSRRDFRAELPSHFGDRCKTWRVGEREQQEGDGRRLAVAAVSAVGGQLTTNLYVLPLSQGDPVCIGSENSVPQWMGWLSNGFLLVLYENRAVLYNTSGGSAGERASYDFGGGTPVSVSNTGNGAALLLSNGQTSTAVLLDGELTVGYSGSVLSASQIIRAKNDGFYLLTDSTVERFNGVGEFQWSQPLSARPRALIEGRQIMVLSGNTVQVVTPPEQTASSGQ